MGEKYKLAVHIKEIQVAGKHENILGPSHDLEVKMKITGIYFLPGTLSKSKC